MWIVARMRYISWSIQRIPLQSRFRKFVPVMQLTESVSMTSKFDAAISITEAYEDSHARLNPQRVLIGIVDLRNSST